MNTMPYRSRSARRAIACTIAAVALTWSGCGGGDSTTDPDPDPDPDPPTYAERVASAWTSFSAGLYTAARSGFTGAVALDPTPADAHVGLGWSELKLDNLDAAHQAFTNGSTATGTNAVLADLFAGWAFTWNARQTAVDRHSESNARIAQAEALEPAWMFEQLSGIDGSDLTLLAAENFFALGAFDSSLVRVQVLDPAFTVDVGTPAGQAGLAAKIEALHAAG